MMADKLKAFLDGHGVPYFTITHSPAYTAQELAHEVHVPGRELAKPVIFQADGRRIMVVVAAPDRVDPEKLRHATGAREVALESEEAFPGLFPGCERGAEPPFGNLFDLPVYVDARLAEGEEIVFNAGTHIEAIRMAYGDYERLVGPQVADLHGEP